MNSRRFISAPFLSGGDMHRGADALVVPQRQMLVIAASMSASLGFGFFASSAAAAMIWPDWQ
jgi:hypothetical protein